MADQTGGRPNKDKEEVFERTGIVYLIFASASTKQK